MLGREGPPCWGGDWGADCGGKAGCDGVGAGAAAWGCGWGVNAETGFGEGDVTVWPQVGQGPETPAMLLGTVRSAWQALQWNWMTSALMCRF